MTDLTEAIHFAEIAIRHEASPELRHTLTDDEWYDLAAAAVHSAARHIRTQMATAAIADIDTYVAEVVKTHKPYPAEIVQSAAGICSTAIRKASA